MATTCSTIKVERFGRSLFVDYVRLCGHSVETVIYTEHEYEAGRYDARTRRLVRDFIADAKRRERRGA